MRMLKTQARPLFDVVAFIGQNAPSIWGEHVNEGHSMKQNQLLTSNRNRRQIIEFQVGRLVVHGRAARSALHVPNLYDTARASGTDRKVPPLVISLRMTSRRPRHHQDVFSDDFQTQKPPRFRLLSRIRWDAEVVRPRDEPSDRNGICWTSHSEIDVGSCTSVASALHYISVHWFVDNY